jgi:8-oxo-dGTP pyrophosphatase MutT (NUDIX family)
MPFSPRINALEAIRNYRARSVVAEGFRPAAVLVLIQETQLEHYVTLIERAATLCLHIGEIAFTGGSVAAEDKDALAAALRESQEEIGINPENVQIIGQPIRSRLLNAISLLRLSESSYRRTMFVQMRKKSGVWFLYRCLMPMFLAVGVVAEGVFLLFLLLCIGAGDILLDFALEDERFFELAIRCHALGIFEDTEFAPPQSIN